MYVHGYVLNQRRETLTGKICKVSKLDSVESLELSEVLVFLI